MKQLLITAAVFLIIEYYSFIALKTAIRNLNHGFHISLYALYFLLTLGVFVSIYAFFNWREGNWPWQSIKLIVNFFIGIFLGKVLIAVIMGIGDVWVLFKWIIGQVVILLGNREEIAGQTTNLLTRSRFIAQAALLIGGLLTAGLAYGMTNRYRYKVRRVRIRPEGLPEAFKGLKIVQISDIHSGSFDNPEAVSEGIDAILEEKPDLILFTGDLVNNRASEIVPYLDIFKRLQAPLGVYSILGNHDYGDYVAWPSAEVKRDNLEQLKRYQEAMGWKLLLNEHVLLEKDHSAIALVGVENWGARAFTRYGNLDKALAGLDPSVFKILMSHDPSHWDAEVRSHPDIALTLSGHTHGMQFGIEIPGFRWSPVQYMYKQWAGLYREGKQFLYVNRGFGFIGYQGRLGILPEITVIEL